MRDVDWVLPYITTTYAAGASSIFFFAHLCVWEYTLYATTVWVHKLERRIYAKRC